MYGGTDVLSNSFPVTNGLKQGAISSPILYCICIDGLFTRFRKKNTGCWVYGTYVGFLAYEGDSLTLNPIHTRMPRGSVTLGGRGGHICPPLVIPDCVGLDPPNSAQ